MTEPMTREQVEALLAGAQEGPWRAEGEPWNRIVWSSVDNRVCFMAHSNGLNDARDVAASDLAAAAPDLARTLLAIMPELEQVKGERDHARQLFMNACEPLAASPDIQDIVTAVEEWVNRRGGEETADQIAIMAVQAYQRATTTAAETALAAMTARCDQMAAAWGEDAVKVEEMTARAGVAIPDRRPSLVWIIENTTQVRVRDLALEIFNDLDAAIRARAALQHKDATHGPE